MAHQQLHQVREARQHYDKAVQWMAKNRPGDITLQDFRTEAAKLLGLSEQKLPTSKPSNSQHKT